MVSTTHGDIVFRVERQWEGAQLRAGVIETPHGRIPTPTAVVVATQASVKGVSPRDLREVGAHAVLANTYHLMLRPGAELVRGAGGLARFMGWDGPTFTDSGGFQVFSLGFGLEHGVGKIAPVFPGEEGPANEERPAPRPKLARVHDEGVTFASHLDGSVQRLTPERSIAMQQDLGADIILAFDECTSPLHDHAYTARALERTHRWARRCLDARTSRQALYGIVQGGHYRDLREASARFIADLPFDGFAIGGDLGRSKADMHRILEWTIPQLPAARPRHLLGIGGVDDLFHGVERGIDTFDCVAPTRLARHGALLVGPAAGGRPRNKFRLNVKNVRFAADHGPVEPGCDCYTCRHFTRAYLRHLLRAGETLGMTLATLHNLRFVLRLMEQIRESIRAGSFADLKRAWLEPE